MVRLASRMFSAISFGVFCRTEPSTRAIIRSTNDWPGSVVIRMTIRSDSTLVPPVTEDRSPPDSRTTGADSPVIADSSTEATPSMMSPSPGMMSPASQTTRSPAFSTAAETCHSWPCASSFRAVAVSRLARSEAACALPRPSATASARFANSTVSHSHTVTEMTNTLGCGEAQHRGQGGADLDDEHHRVVPHHPRIQVAQPGRQRLPQARRVEHPDTDAAGLELGVVLGM